MKRMICNVVTAAALVAGWSGIVQAGQAPQAPANLDEYVKLVRSDVQNQKSQVIGAALELSATEAAAFWPVYKQYEGDLTKIFEERFAAIKDYAANYATLTPAKASELTDRALALEEKRLALVKRALGQIRGVLPAAKAARWYQVEMALNKAVDLRLAAEIPLAR